jgi:hypothetical protein
VLTGVVVGICFVASGCGGSANSHVAQLSTERGSAPSADLPHNRALAYAGCMHTHGVPRWPDPGNSGSPNQSPLTLRELGVTSSQLTAAQQACRSLVPTASATQHSPHILAQALRFSQCMRGHGSTDFPDPESNGAIAIPHSMENSPMYLAALHICLHKYGPPPPPGSASKT